MDIIDKINLRFKRIETILKNWIFQERKKQQLKKKKKKKKRIHDKKFWCTFQYFQNHQKQSEKILRVYKNGKKKKWILDNHILEWIPLDIIKLN